MIIVCLNIYALCVITPSESWRLQFRVVNIIVVELNRARKVEIEPSKTVRLFVVVCVAMRKFSVLISHGGALLCCVWLHRSFQIVI